MAKIDHERPSLRHKKRSNLLFSQAENKASVSNQKNSKIKVFKYGKPKLLKKGKIVD